MFRFLHLADVHLDTRFLGWSGALRELLKESQLRAFKKAVDTALTEKIDSVLIAGDLFDNERLSLATERFLLEQTGRLNNAGIPCVYVTGNHDPGATSYRAQSIEWPPNFHVLGHPRPRVIEIKDAQDRLIARVAGAGHESPSEARNLVPDFPPGDSCSVPMVGLLHTYVTGAMSAEHHDRYAPCSTADLKSRNYAYWALGHVHTQQKVNGDLDAWYPGVLQGRHPGETGSKGGLIVSISDQGFTDVEFRPFASVVWETLKLDQLAEVVNLSDLRALAVSAFEERCGTVPTADWVLRIRLEGPCPLAQTLSDTVELETLQEDLQSLLGARFVELRTRRLTPLVDVNRFRDDVHVLSEILALIDEAGADNELLKTLSPQILAGPVDEFSDSSSYLKELLSGLDYEAVSRLVDLEDAH